MIDDDSLWQDTIKLIGAEPLCDPSGWPDPDEPVVVPQEFIPEGEDGDRDEMDT